MHEIQVLLLTTALPILIKCLYNISSMINSLRKEFEVLITKPKLRIFIIENI